MCLRLGVGVATNLDGTVAASDRPQVPAVREMNWEAAEGRGFFGAGATLTIIEEMSTSMDIRPRPLERSNCVLRVGMYLSVQLLRRESGRK